MPRPSPDHRTTPPRRRSARVCPALQHTPTSPILGSAPAPRRHAAKFCSVHPRAPTEPGAAASSTSTCRSHEVTRVLGTNKGQRGTTARWHGLGKHHHHGGPRDGASGCRPRVSVTMNRLRIGPSAGDQGGAAMSYTGSGMRGRGARDQLADRGITDVGVGAGEGLALGRC